MKIKIFLFTVSPQVKFKKKIKTLGNIPSKGGDGIC